MGNTEVEVLSLSKRQQREKEYYDRYVETYNQNVEVDFSPVVSVLEQKETRPWNSYWQLYKRAIDLYKKEDKLLDFGSGPGLNSLLFRKIGYNVTGVDISPNNVKTAKNLSEKYNLDIHFIEGTTENTGLNPQLFDLIVGVDILHHIDIEKSLLECKKLLKPGGRAIFREPLSIKGLDDIRNTKLVQFFFPKEMSFELHITDDEKKLTTEDLETIKKVFPKTSISSFFLFARFDRFFRKGSDPRVSFLEKFDHFLFKKFPSLQKFGGAILIEMEKE